MPSRRLLACLLLPLIVAGSVACARGGGDVEERLKLLETSQSEMAAQLRKVTVELDSLNKAQLIGALDIIDRSGIHEMDEDLQEATRINPLYVGTVRKLKRVIIGTPWPRPLKEKEEALKAALGELETALTNTDLAASREAVRQVHILYHPLLEAGWRLVAAEPAE